MGNFYNWGYSLHIGIDDFSKNETIFRNSLSKLTYPVRDANYYNLFMHQISSGRMSDYYYHRLNLLNQNATILNVIKEIINLVKMVESGDIVTITYSGHGIHFNNNNIWFLSDYFLYDYELYLLCKLFPYDVRVIIISDCCQSSGMIDLLHNELPFKSYQKLIDRVKLIDESFAFKLEALLKFKNIDRTMCNLTHISSTNSDETNVNDSITFLYFFNQYLEKFQNVKHNMYDFMVEIRKIALACFIEYPKVFRGLAFEEDSDLAYDPNNEKDVKGMDKILPSYSVLGYRSNIYTNKKAFHVL